ncbi:MAG: hypothetical protein KZQ70_04465 [gamma proteobacterium symbiont of Lucinoma myriamae]|nr:hypothetical protein [gamma proteobacterium symbiont of Lucinoma myriamae]MCU7833059.1 hypothetical protein [gamma proteobacterium symbiont of Lucinoma myriamae]
MTKFSDNILKYSIEFPILIVVVMLMGFYRKVILQQYQESQVNVSKFQYLTSIKLSIVRNTGSWDMLNESKDLERNSKDI